MQHISNGSIFIVKVMPNVKMRGCQIVVLNVV